MNLQAGQSVFLTEKYNGYPEGTKLTYLFDVSDSGSTVPLCLVDDERTKEGLNTLGLYSAKQLVEACEKEARNSNMPYSLAETYCTTIKPWPRQIKTLESVNESIKQLEAQLEKLRKEQSVMLRTPKEVKTVQSVYFTHIETKGNAKDILAEDLEDNSYLRYYPHGKWQYNDTTREAINEALDRLGVLYPPEDDTFYVLIQDM